MHTIGWIGLGHMGVPMAANLRKKDVPLNVYNRTADKARALTDLGARQLPSVRSVTEQSEITVVMLSDTAAIAQVFAGDEGLLAGLTPGKIVVNMSTIAPLDAQGFAKQVEEKGGIYIDAPVSGSVGPATAGQLVILTGGDQQTVALCQPYFDIMGKKTLYFGPVGKGSAAKLTINLLLGVVVQGCAEAVLFSEKMGLDRETVLELIGQSAMNSPIFQAKREAFKNEEFPAAFMVELMSKDLGLFQAEADKLGLTLPLGAAANSAYRSAKDSGKGKMDLAAVFLELKENNPA